MKKINTVLLSGIILISLNLISGLTHAHDTSNSQLKDIQKYQSNMDAAMTDMHHRMSNIELSGDENIDFMRMMIPHHQGAIDMARIILEKTQDKEVKNLAMSIITEQENEIVIMNQLIKEKTNAY